jgi:hypothetical protein
MFVAGTQTVPFRSFYVQGYFLELRLKSFFTDRSTVQA